MLATCVLVPIVFSLWFLLLREIVMSQIDFSMGYEYHFSNWLPFLKTIIFQTGDTSDWACRVPFWIHWPFSSRSGCLGSNPIIWVKYGLCNRSESCRLAVVWRDNELTKRRSKMKTARRGIKCVCNKSISM